MADLFLDILRNVLEVVNLACKPKRWDQKFLTFSTVNLSIASIAEVSVLGLFNKAAVGGSIPRSMASCCISSVWEIGQNTLLFLLLSVVLTMSTDLICAVGSI